VTRVIDVRAVPLSRRPGFSKNILKNGLAEAGIDYVHLKALGTPAEGREAARKGRHAELERIYAGQLELPEAIVAGAQMRELGGGEAERVAVLRARSVGVPPDLLLREVAGDAEVCRFVSVADLRRHNYSAASSSGLVVPTSSASIAGMVWPVISLGTSHTTRRAASLCSLLAQFAERLGRGDDRQRFEIVGQRALVDRFRGGLGPAIFLQLVEVGFLIGRAAAVAGGLPDRARRIGLHLGRSHPAARRAPRCAGRSG
jgi:hypothetical protein